MKRKLPKDQFYKAAKTLKQFHTKQTRGITDIPSFVKRCVTCILSYLSDNFVKTAENTETVIHINDYFTISLETTGYNRKIPLTI